MHQMDCRCRSCDAGWSAVGVIMCAVGVCALLLLAIFLTGCQPMVGPAQDATDEVQRQGWELDSEVMMHCTLPAEAVPDLPLEKRAAEVQRLKDIGCPLAWQAQTDISEAHATMYALVSAYVAGACVATIARDVPDKCSIPRTMTTMLDAAVRLEAAVRRIRERTAKR